MAQRAEAEELAREIEEAYSGVRTYRARAAWISGLARVPRALDATVYFEAPDRFKWDFDEDSSQHYRSR
jgi:outer membrane lipoprotein-sorting protein